MAKNIRSFFFHFNKPATQKAKKIQVSVHYDKTCYIVDNVVCKVPTQGKLRKRQPRFVMSGKCKEFKIENGVAIIE